MLVQVIGIAKVFDNLDCTGLRFDVMRVECGDPFDFWGPADSGSFFFPVGSHFYDYLFTLPPCTYADLVFDFTKPEPYPLIDITPLTLA